MKQRTIKKEFLLEGKGLHSGKKVSVRCMPAPAGHGIKFYRTDIAGTPCIEATPDHVGATNRGTTIQHTTSGIEVKTIEHLMSALAGMNIYNAKIYTDGEEVPILSGNAETCELVVKLISKDGICADSRYFNGFFVTIRVLITVIVIVMALAEKKIITIFDTLAS